MKHREATIHSDSPKDSHFAHHGHEFAVLLRKTHPAFTSGPRPGFSNREWLPIHFWPWRWWPRSAGLTRIMRVERTASDSKWSPLRYSIWPKRLYKRRNS